MVKKKKTPRLVTCKKCKGKPCTQCKGTGKTKAINARSKGAVFERNIAKEVSEWTGITFSRTPSSGGWAKTGDITPKDPKQMVDFPFNMELKNNQSWNLSELLKGTGVDGIEAFWDQCTSDAKKSKRIPLLVFTQNGEDVYCMMYEGHVHQCHKLIDYIDGATFLFQNRLVFLWSDFLRQNYKKLIKQLKG